MNRYLLLRDNKESGPYTLAELVSKGIKPYDLVWVEGRSAAWRYPSELDELKRYSPVVEEQPYDRFYKRPSDAKMPARQLPGNSVVSETENVVNSADKAPHPFIITAETDRDPTSRMDQIPHVDGKPDHKITVLPNAVAVSSGIFREIQTKHPKIFVTLPGPANSQAPVRNALKTSAPQPAAQSIDEVKREPVAPVHSDLDISSADTERFSLSNEIKDKAPSGFPAGSFVPTQYPVQETRTGLSAEPAASQPRRSQVFNKRISTRTAMALLTGICLLLGGVVIGLAISNMNNKNDELEALVNSIQQRQKSATVPPDTEVPTTQTLITDTEQPSPVTDAKEEKPQVNQVAERTPVQEPIAPQAAPTDSDPIQAVTTPATSGIDARNTVLREPTVPTAAQIEAAKRNISKNLSLEANDYRVGVLGGITGLELSISNASHFDLNQVVAEVEYLGPEKRVVKRQTIVFNNIRAGQTRTQEVPRTNRGVSINYSIKSIEPGKLKSGTINL